jgi:hypothetical protein
MKHKRAQYIGLLMVICTVLYLLSYQTTFSVESFSDVKTTDWFYQDMMDLVSRGVIDGYSDNTFKASNRVTVAEFIKMVLTVSNQTILIPEKDVSWYSRYVHTAMLNDYIDKNYYLNYERPITRSEMGNIIDRILKLRYNNAHEYIPQIFDYATIQEAHKISSLNVYIAGIITGYSDRTIRPDANATRAEAATVIARLSKESRRKPPELGVVSGENEGENSDSILPVTKAFSLSGLQIGFTKEYLLQRLGTPTEILKSSYGYDWYVYASDYTTFRLFGIHNNKIVALYSDKQFTSTKGVTIGTSDDLAKKSMFLTEYDSYYYVEMEGMQIKLFSEKNVNDGIEGILVVDSLFVLAIGKFSIPASCPKRLTGCLQGNFPSANEILSATKTRRSRFSCAIGKFYF